ncbi:hypothetical protein [Streptomyces silvisoli]|uniref:MFS transporter n=1 Tax=Streptomyces silvisoli TaxID=3034235 RepID=A0ABT5ZUH8_9ACTN|nr:hypothetical protein [Streptomyces silvisoli]MDF3293260.1 hypothetical protein [Streptomyces silvisoli]
MPWRIGIGSGVVLITYVGLIAARPDSVRGGVGGPAALLALCGYTLGAMPIASGVAGALARLGWFRRLPTAVLARVVIGVAGGVGSAPSTAFVFGNASGSVGRSALIATCQAYGNSTRKAASLQGLVADPLGKALTVVLALTVPAGFARGHVHRFLFV